MLGGKTMVASWPAVTSVVYHTTPFNLATDYMYMCVAMFAASPPLPLSCVQLHMLH